jgi:hypothetical protein
MKVLKALMLPCYVLMMAWTLFVGVLHMRSLRGRDRDRDLSWLDADLAAGVAAGGGQLPQEAAAGKAQEQQGAAGGGREGADVSGSDLQQAMSTSWLVEHEGIVTAPAVVHDAQVGGRGRPRWGGVRPKGAHDAQIEGGGGAAAWLLLGSAHSGCCSGTCWLP